MPIGRGSRAILIGVADYHDEDAFRRVPAAINSLRGMREVLTDPQLGGWPDDAVIAIENPENSVRLVQRMRRIAEEATAALLIYFVGHGVMTEDMELCFAIADTEAGDLDLTGVEYSKLRKIFRASSAQVKIAIFDCCFSGRTIDSLSPAGSQLADSTDIAGVYTLTAADTFAHVVPEVQQAHACTSFTGALLDVIRTGVAAGPAEITLGALYALLRTETASRGLPRINRRGTDTVDAFVFTRNAKYLRGGPPGPPRTRPSFMLSRVPEEAEHTALAIDHPDAQADAIVEIAEFWRTADPDRTLRLLAHAERTARTITDLACQSALLARIAAARAVHDIDDARPLFDEAVRIALRCSEPPGFQGNALLCAALAWAAHDLGQAEQAALQIADPGRRTRALAGIAQIAVTSDLNRAERLARAISGSGAGAPVLASIAAQVAVYDPDRADRALQDIGPADERVTAMINVATAVTSHDAARARQLVDQAANTALSGTAPGVPQIMALMTVAAAVLTDDPDRARRLLETAERITAGTGGKQGHASIEERLAGLVATYDPGRGERIARAISRPEQRACALTAVAERIAGRDHGRAQILLGDAHDAVLGITSPTRRDAGLSGICMRAFAFDPARAAEFTSAITSPVARAEAQTNLAVLAHAARPAYADEILERAQETAAAIVDRIPRVTALIRIGHAQAGSPEPSNAEAARMPGMAVPPLPAEVARLLRSQVRAAQERQYQFSGAAPGGLPAPLDQTLEEHASEPRTEATPEFLARAAGQAGLLLVLGEPGLGKTTLTWQLAARLASDWLEGAANRGVLPLRVSAASLAAQDGPLGQGLVRAASHDLSSMLDYPLAEDLLDIPSDDTRWLVLVDGLSEIIDPGMRRTLICRLADHRSERLRMLITSDGLPQDEYDRLRYSGAICYQLQRFDHEQVDQFMQRWYSHHEDAAELTESIQRQLDGRLRHLAGVPLLAAVAAVTHQQDPARLLPRNRYGLYEQYLACLLRNLAPETAQCWNAVRRALPPSAPVNAAALRHLQEHLSDLIEHLAEQAVRGEPRLVEAALAWADAHDARPMQEHLRGWPGLLSAVLKSTGLLQQGVNDLRFVHQDLARHIASTAAARRLPAAFDPQDPSWAAALHAALYRDDTAVLVHHTHLHASGNDILSWLEAGDQYWQGIAGRILAEGARADHDHVLQFIANTRYQVNVPSRYDSMYLEFNHMGDIGGDAVLDFLGASASDAGAEASHRINAAKAMAKIDPAAAVQVLRNLTSDPKVTSDRYRGADPAIAMARLGPQHASEASRALQAAIKDANLGWDQRESAVHCLVDLGASSTSDAARALLAFTAARETDAYDRARAAKLLAALFPKHQPQAAQALQTALAQPGLSHGGRRNLGEALAGLEPGKVGQAVQIMRDIIEDPDTGLDPYYRQEAAGTLFKLGPQYATEAVRALRAIMSDIPRYRTYAAETMYALGAQYRGEVTQALLAVVHDAEESLNYRISTGELLARLDRSTSQNIAGVLREILTDASTAFSWKLSTAETLGKLDLQYRDEAAAAMRAIIADPACPPHERTRGIEMLVKIDPGSASRAAETLREVIRSAEAASTRSDAAQALISIQPYHRDEAAEAFRRRIADADSQDSGRPYAANYMASLGPPYITEAARHLREIVGDIADPETGAAEEARWKAAEFLCHLGPAYVGDAAWAIRTFITDPDARSRRPDAIWILARLDPHYASQASRELRTLISRSNGDARAHLQELLRQLEAG